MNHWLDRYKTAARAFRFEEAAGAGEQALDAGLDLHSLVQLRGPFFDDNRMHKQAPAKFWSGMARAVKRAALPKPWAAFFGHWSLQGKEWPRRKAGEARAFSLLKKAGPRYGWMLALPARSFLVVGRCREAEIGLRAAAASMPFDWPTRFFLAEVLLAQGKTAAGLAQARRALAAATSGDRGRALAWSGKISLWIGRYEKALAELEEAVGLGAAEGLCWKAGALLKLGRFQEALEAADARLAGMPGDSEARLWRAEALMRLGRPGEAVSELDRADSLGVPTYVFFSRLLRRLCRRPTRALEAELARARGVRADDHQAGIWRR